MKRHRGFILVVALLGIGIMFFFALSMVRHYAADKSLSSRGENTLIAEQAAIAGVEDAMIQLKTDTRWSAGFNKAVLPHSGATYTVTFDKNQAAIPYSTNNATGSTALTGYGGRIVPPQFVHFIAKGEYRGAVAYEEVLVTRGTKYKVALFGSDSIFLSGTVYVDSYDSSQGTYAQTKRASGGDMATNASAPGSVTLKNVSIMGTLSVGPGGSEATTLNIIGSPYYMAFSVLYETQSLPPTPFPDMGASKGTVTAASKQTVSIMPGTYSGWDAKGGIIDLAAGNYVITGDITMSSGSVIRVKNGPVNLFLQGNLNSSSGASIANYTMQSQQLSLYGGTAAQSINLQGLSGTMLSLRIYAPMAALTFGGGNDFYGSFVAKTLTVSGNSNFHYDSAPTKVSTEDPFTPVITMRCSPRW
ncbi:MAG: hypothetical protein RDV48_25510 [Candidatus Eremiobacteraeota bacterium]|nr:hypothetical protein [Candidatus Eremiobacteraeota bacterium]